METQPGPSRLHFCVLVGFSPDGVPDVPAWFRERGDAVRGEIVGPWEALVGERIPIWDSLGITLSRFRVSM
ncbi:hypothetical protein L210DRAFT_3535401 [Boletus edulis BED1]|uniref:Uncharacterized protein n=1 Tax=Boletus edulis BED1 TaxID=1328754 RepID=A0AAD4BYR2_BOLED|nr:hypothetical protein L210DRAFT_3535401 [Boletus edulis BED1]